MEVLRDITQEFRLYGCYAQPYEETVIKK